MKKDTWIVYLIIAITSTTTVLTMSDGTLFGFIRGVLFAAVLDGFILYWENRAQVLHDDKQRKWANGMKWAGAGMLVAIAFAYVLVSFAPVDAPQTVDVFGLVIASTVREVVHWTIVAAVSLWVVLTLIVALYMRQIDPEVVAQLERTKAIEESEKERRAEETRAYKTAMTVVNRTVGIEKALRSFRENLESTGYYREFEIDRMVEDARMEIEANKTGGIPVGTPVNTYHSDTSNPTPPSTHQT
jgi:hypothetical protein